MTVPFLLGSHAPNIDAINHPHRSLPPLFRFSISWTKQEGGKEAAWGSPTTGHAK